MSRIIDSEVVKTFNRFNV